MTVNGGGASNGINGRDTPPLTALPVNFEQNALARFDGLLEQELLFYAETDPDIVEDQGFTFEFHVSPALVKKPILAVNAPERKGKGGPFIDPDPRFVVAEVGRDHILEFSMYCMFRPHYVLHTRLFARQTDPLDLSDFAAAWAVMTACSQDTLMVYNCGYHAGASQGHKHLQIVPRDWTIPLFPEQADSEDVIKSDCNGVGYEHFVLRVPAASDAAHRFSVYEKLMAQVRKLQQRNKHLSTVDAHNVVMTKDWLCVIPRTRGGIKDTGANSLSMIGLVWVKDQEEKDDWIRLGLATFLNNLGYPKSGEILPLNADQES